MCNIWKNHQGRELPIEQLRSLFSNPYFGEVRHVGITGGEPTLRPDLLHIYELFPSVFPAFEGGSFITHGMQTKRCLAVYPAVHAAYRERKLAFSGMVSLDGVDSVHDQVRGVAGAFEKTTRTIFGLRDAGLETIACCTIVKANVYNIETLLDWCRSKDVRIRFRIGEFINRLYNSDRGEQIRAFNPDEHRTLVAFFLRLIAEYETDPTIQRTYQSILHQLTGGSRQIGCPYRNGSSINIDCEGKFAICAPKGTPRDFAERPTEALALAANERLEILEKHCRNCIHDYHAPWDEQSEIADRDDPLIWSTLYGRLPDPSELPAMHGHQNLDAPILITGWYGTETVGDVAILRGILSERLAKSPGQRFIICSLQPAWTRQTVRDLPHQLAAAVDRVVSYGGSEALEALSVAGKMIVAGGPLMDIPDLRLLACLAIEFRKRGRPVEVDGCGLGPLRHPERRQEAIALLTASTTVALRDQASQRLAAELVPGLVTTVRHDPAITEVNRLTGTQPIPTMDGILRAFLREPTPEYPMMPGAMDVTNWLGELLHATSLTIGATGIELLPMHGLAHGGDDRRFSKKIAEKVQGATAAQRLQTPESVLAAMQRSPAVVCMRYHSVVFARTLRRPFLAVDYTGGGKIPAFLADEGLEGLALTPGDPRLLDHGEITRRLACSQQ
jgi:polysaccharide pyruvyl transferase WcaK-like protein/sulfatase maturation enzyme AslB (radical SAM superfamily)